MVLDSHLRVLAAPCLEGGRLEGAAEAETHVPGLGDVLDLKVMVGLMAIESTMYYYQYTLHLIIKL